MPKTIIIIIEDDADILDMMTFILKDEGYAVIGATDCSPLEKVMNFQPDLILMDNRLTTGSGTDACRKLKEDAATAHIPVVLVSAINGFHNWLSKVWLTVMSVNLLTWKNW